MRRLDAVASCAVVKPFASVTGRIATRRV
jgi:hypothetical protein